MEKSQNKYSKWMITIRSDESKKQLLPTSTVVGVIFESMGEKYCFQKEKCPTSGNDHWQCCLETFIRKRHYTILNELLTAFQLEDSQVQIDRMQGSFDQAVLYCSKEDTRTGETTYKSKNLKDKYSGNDISFLLDKTKRFPWQNSLFEKIFNEAPYDFKDPDDRTIIWCEDRAGNCGKSKLVKFCCYYNTDTTKISFGSAGQLRSGVIDAGPHKCYFIDIPRTLGYDDAINNIISVIEDLKGGFVVSNFHGQSRRLMCEPPHIVIFSNFECPLDKLSSDRWQLYYITQDKRLV